MVYAVPPPDANIHPNEPLFGKHWTLDAYGADPARWPANERKAALAFAQDDARADDAEVPPADDRGADTARAGRADGRAPHRRWLPDPAGHLAGFAQGTRNARAMKKATRRWP